MRTRAPVAGACCLGLATACSGAGGGPRARRPVGQLAPEGTHLLLDLPGGLTTDGAALWRSLVRESRAFAGTGASRAELTVDRDAPLVVTRLTLPVVDAPAARRRVDAAAPDLLRRLQERHQIDQLDVILGRGDAAAVRSFLQVSDSPWEPYSTA